mgnify:CR=1 FL=1
MNKYLFNYILGFTFLCAAIVINVERDNQTETSTTLTVRDGMVWMKKVAQLPMPYVAL